MLTTKSPARLITGRCLPWKWTTRIPYLRCDSRLDSIASRRASSGVKKHANGEERKTRGSYTSVLATLAVSGAIGWGLHTWQDDRQGRVQVAKPSDFVKYGLAKKEDVSSTCSIFTLRPATSTIIDSDGLKDHRAITSVQFKQPQLQIARNYTVLPPVEGQEPQELRFLIRKEWNGEVSGYLHRLPLGSEIELRGPSVECVVPDQARSIVFLAGGTGIAPAMQLAEKVEGSDIHILWASRRRDDCEGGVSDTEPLKADSGWCLFRWWAPVWHTKRASPAQKTAMNPIVAELERIKQHNSTMDGSNRTVKVDYFVDEEGTFIHPSSVSKLVESLRHYQDAAEKEGCLLAVSGPEGFINYWAGPKQWQDGNEVQGPLGGVLSTLDLRGWKVVKM